MWPSTSSTTSTRRPSRPPRSWHAGPTHRARPSFASRRRSASRASPSCRPRRARNTAASTPTRAKGRQELGAAVLPRPERVRVGSGRRPPECRGDRAQGLPQRRRVADRRDRRGRQGAGRRHRPDGLLRKLPAPSADAARPARRRRRQPFPGGAQQARADRREHPRHRPLGRPAAPVGRARHEACRHRQARTAAITDATLSEVAKLAQIKLYYSSNSPAYVRSHVALLSIIQALAYGVYAQDTAQYDDRIKAFRLK